MAPPNHTPVTISVRDAVALSSLSDWEIRELANKGIIPAVRHGRRILIDFAGFEAWLKGLTPVTEAAS